jgi:hypothetical protein
VVPATAKPINATDMKRRIIPPLLFGMPDIGITEVDAADPGALSRIHAWNAWNFYRLPR